MPRLAFFPARIKGLCLIKPFFAQDERGYFLKSFERDAFLAHGIDMDIQESFETWSHKGVLRGMHFQRKAPQGKLIRALKGRIFDVAADLRQGSDTFGQWEGFMLDDEERCSLYIPPGFAHGFLVVSETAQVSYQCAGAYLEQEDTGIIWNDPDISIQWPLHMVDSLVVSPRDRGLPSLREFLQAQQASYKEEPML